MTFHRKILATLTSVRKTNYVNKTVANLQFINTVKPVLNVNLSSAEKFHSPENPNFKYPYEKKSPVVPL
jgi:hypothetical protein